MNLAPGMCTDEKEIAIYLSWINSTVRPWSSLVRTQASHAGSGKACCAGSNPAGRTIKILPNEQDRSSLWARYVGRDCQRRPRLPRDGAIEGQQAPSVQEEDYHYDNVNARPDRAVHYRLKDGLGVAGVRSCSFLVQVKI